MAIDFGIKTPPLLRPDVKAALRAGLDSLIDEELGTDGGAGLVGIRRRIHEAAGEEFDNVDRAIFVRALEAVLDQVAAAFPVTEEPVDHLCPECDTVPQLARRDVAGYRMEWECPSGHRWTTDLERPMPSPGEPVTIPATASEEFHYFNAVNWLQSVQWVDDGQCPECQGLAPGSAEAAGPTDLGHHAGCEVASAIRCFGLEPFLQPAHLDDDEENHDVD